MTTKQKHTERYDSWQSVKQGNGKDFGRLGELALFVAKTLVWGVSQLKENENRNDVGYSLLPGWKWSGVTVQRSKRSKARQKKHTPVASKQEGSYVASRTSVEVDKKGKVKPTQQIHVVIYNQLQDKYEPNIQRQHVHITHLCSYSGSQQVWLRMTNRWMNPSVDVVNDSDNSLMIDSPYSQ